MISFFLSFRFLKSAELSRSCLFSQPMSRFAMTMEMSACESRKLELNMQLAT